MNDVKAKIQYIQKLQTAQLMHEQQEREKERSEKFTFVNDLARNYCIQRYFVSKCNQDLIPFMPQDYVMDIKEEERYSQSNYPKLNLLFEAKNKLIDEKRHPKMTVVTPDLRKTNLLMFEKQFDVVVLKLPIDQNGWTLDHFQNSLRIDLIAENPSFVVVGCGSSIKGLQIARKLLVNWGFRRSEDIVWLKQST